MGPLRRSVSVRLEDEAYFRLRRHSLQSGIPTSALVRALVRRWLEDQEGKEETPADEQCPERQPGLFGDEAGL